MVSSQQFLESARKKQLYPQQVVTLQSTPKRAPHRHILVVGKNKQEIKHKNLCIHDPAGGYSTEIKTLMQPYYLFL